MISMEQLTKQILIRISEKDYELLAAQAKDQNRSIAWVARENLKKAIAN